MTVALHCRAVVPSQVRFRLRRARDWVKAAAEDAWLFVTGRSDPELPPLRLRFVGAGDFRSVGAEMVNVLTSFGGLKAGDRVLDTGCGIGRIALPLTRYLDAGATYDGFDIVGRGIRWCRRHITSRHPNFRFHLVDVRNPEYNRRGVPASQFRFPFADASFDFVFATSLYTHLDEAEMLQYVRESRRVLMPGGTFLATFFLVDEVALASMSLRSAYHFPIVDGVIRRMPGVSAAAGVAFEESFVVRTLEGAGFASVRIARGKWSRPEGLTFQDVVVAR
jgi:SAM-dependent methyltransferase